METDTNYWYILFSDVGHMRLLFLGAINRLRILLSNFEYKQRSVSKPEHFSREGGKLGFVNTLLNMLNFNNKSQQIEIDRYFALIESDSPASKQAFSAARQKINPLALKEMFDVTVGEVANNRELASVGGFTPVAVDGSTLALDNLPKLEAHFGCAGPNSTSCTARISIACEPVTGTILDAAICPYKKGERELALEHIDRILELGVPNPMFITDRGYCSLKLMAHIADENCHYIHRVRDRWMAKLIASTESGAWTEFRYGKKAYPVRVLKLTTPSGAQEILLTNLESFTEADFLRLYTLRWPVETKYDVVKNKLMLENFTGKTVAAVQQDFWATMTLANLVAFAKLETDYKIALEDRDKNLKHTYQTNTNVLIGNLKDKLILMLLCDDPVLQNRMFDNIVNRVAKSKVPITRGHSNPRRPTRQKKRFNQCTKSAL